MFKKSCADLPLFSGSPQKADEPEFKPQPQAQQPGLFACRFCYDAGYVHVNGKSQYCNCQAGQRLRQRAQLPCQMCNGTGYTSANRYDFCSCAASQRVRISRDILSLSGSTMVALIQFTRRYDDLDAIQTAAAEWVSKQSEIFDCWQDAWEAFRQAVPDLSIYLHKDTE